MPIGWITHIDLSGSSDGGAEMSDIDTLSHAPDEVRIIHPDHLEELEGCDPVVVAGSYRIRTPEQMQRILEFAPVMWAHGYMGHSLYRHALPLFEGARLFIALTPQHLVWEREWIDRSDWAICRGWFDTSDLYAEEKDIPLLWPHRMIDHKGLDLAERWAGEHGLPLTVVSGVSKAEARSSIRRAERVILLSKIRDAGPRAVHEARICGAEIIVNDKVGYFDEDPEVLRARIDRAADEFWRMVCDR